MMILTMTYYTFLWQSLQTYFSELEVRMVGGAHAF